MKHRPARISLTQRENQRLAVPATFLSLALESAVLIFGITPILSGAQQTVYLGIGLASLMATILEVYLLPPWIEQRPALKWMLALLNGALVGLLFIIRPFNSEVIPVLIMTATVTLNAIFIGRWPVYLYVLLVILIRGGARLSPAGAPGLDLIQILDFPLFSIFLAETLLWMNKVIHTQINRLAAVNNVAHSLATSLETPQVIALVRAALQKILQADTYYVGLLNRKKLRLEFLCDEGELFPLFEIPIENTLAGWVLKEKKSLLLGNVPKESPRLGIKPRILGKPRTSRSWMGAPLDAGGHLLGLIAVASYQFDAFDENDLEILENVAQQAALSIDNAYHHAEVEQQSRLDSLTGAYNHGYFLKAMAQEIECARQGGYPVSLIMLDVDFFKLYNDTYGHLVGDQVLTILTETIRGHTKSADLVGRWGGEEFAILLPKTGGAQALHVAQRIQQSMNTISLTTRKKENIPAPTVSQGIAVFPDERGEPFSLIDLADQRLYVAKNRGRNQVEPHPGFWKSAPSEEEISSDGGRSKDIEIADPAG